MNNETIPSRLRRSSRVPAAIPIFVTSLNGTHFSEMCETLVVNAHGCAIRSSVKLDTGVPLHFHNKVGRETTAQVVSCYPMGPENQNWLLGAKLDRPENFWGLPNYPKDWVLPLTSTSPKIPPPPIQGSHDLPVLTSHALELSGERAAPQLSEKDVRRLIVEAIRSLHAEITAIKEKLARGETNRSRFEVSLSSIPPELEQQTDIPPNPPQASPPTTAPACADRHCPPQRAFQPACEKPPAFYPPRETHGPIRQAIP